MTPSPRHPSEADAGAVTRARRWRRTPFIPARYFDSLATLVAPGRLRRAALLAEAGLDSDRLDHADNLLSLEELERLVSRARDKAEDADLALRLGAELNLSAHGTLGLAGLSSATLGDAIQVAVECFPLVTPLLAPDYRRDHTTARLRISPACPLSMPLYRFLLESLLASLHVQGHFLLQGRIPEVRVRAPFPEHLSRYRSNFPELIIEALEGRECELVFPGRVMDSPLPLANPDVREQARRECRQRMERLPHPDRPVRTMQRLLREARPPADAAAAAARMGLSERSLRRHLAEKGTSFRELALAARMDRARQLLEQKGLSVSETAFHCGYTDVGNFSRAWKRHFGFPPGRRQPGADDTSGGLS